MGNKVRIIDVGPRDGFQSVKEFIPTPLKIEIIDRIVRAGVREIQATSFISPKAIPQMRDAKEVIAGCLARHPEVAFTALTPNYRGVSDAWESGIREVSYIISVSESHNKANVNRSVGESFEELAKIRADFPGMEIVLDVVTAFGCPFEVEVPFEKVYAHLERAAALGITQACLCDTIGLAVPNQVREYFQSLIAAFPGMSLGVHIHDTRNMGIVNTLAALENGAAFAQAALGGLGGCPFAPGASGNTSTEDLVYMLNQMGYDTGIDFDELLSAAKILKERVDGNYSGHQIFITRQPGGVCR